MHHLPCTQGRESSLWAPCGERDLSAAEVGIENVQLGECCEELTGAIESVWLLGIYPFMGQRMVWALLLLVWGSLISFLTGQIAVTFLARVSMDSA